MQQNYKIKNIFALFIFGVVTIVDVKKLID
jgi:hypothetical protein